MIFRKSNNSWVPATSNMQQIEIWLVILYLSRREFHAKQMFVLSSSMKLGWSRSPGFQNGHREMSGNLSIESWLNAWFSPSSNLTAPDYCSVIGFIRFNHPSFSWQNSCLNSFHWAVFVGNFTEQICLLSRKLPGDQSQMTWIISHFWLVTCSC